MANNGVTPEVLDGTDLILSFCGVALGFSTSCKITTTAELGERVTKEAASGKWKEQFVKNFSESITADGVVLKNGTTELPSYDELKAMQLAGQPIEATYGVRNGQTREGSTTAHYKGNYLIDSLELDGQAGEDSKYSISLKNSGPVTKVGGGLKATA